ncbi:uncharacterized protein LOC113780933 isoform X1 [Coffea eugenioides]|uniref:uncharacterized protein LOC113780933 isoform X1 n=1 Tax=Coffea eugenioides TaxID=49369 RepID=UPI000F5CC90D|nr:uncharacterized protein LOC113704365 isoform X1 [Coffea arabica]XP_027182518.1 uncharacterized protein LOC113780933 isoform X1 [Coffea eugenioides]
MASKCSSRIMNRSTISSLKSSFNKSASSSSSLVNRSIPTSFPKSTNATTSFLRRFSLSRAPSELGAVQSMLPLHSAVATARMTSCLSLTSRSCRALSQELGQSVPR